MTARVFVHPKALSGQNYDAISRALNDHGFDLSRVCVGPADARGRRELVRVVQQQGPATMFERFDGTRFHYHPMTPPPQAA